LDADLPSILGRSITLSQGPRLDVIVRGARCLDRAPLIRLATALLLALGMAACSTVPKPPAATPVGALDTAPTAEPPAQAATATAPTPSAAPSAISSPPASVPDAPANTATADASQLNGGASAATPDPMKALLAVKPPTAVEQIDVWERIRRGFAIPDLQTKLAADRTRWYAAETQYFDRMSQRASLYLFHIVEEVEKRGMPTELALLPFVESAMQPEAVSSAKAAGLWQFIPSTGKIYSLEQNLWHDQRRDVVESTRAALDYLQKLHRDFGDWHLALAAYNWGEGAVGRAIARNKQQRKPTGYTDLRMPRETQHYVPKLQAIKNIVRDPAQFGITLPAIRNEPYFVALTKQRDIDVTTAARLAEMPIEDFLALNPSFNRPLIIGASQPSILLPAERAETFRGNLAAYEATGQPLASWTAHVLKQGETLAQVAKKADISETKLREANRIPPRYRLAPGSIILVPRDETMEDDIAVKHVSASFSLVPESANMRQITYKVRRGETLHSVARRWKVQPDEITAWNNLRSPTLFRGQRLTLIVVRAPAKKPAARGAVRPGSTRASAKSTPSKPSAKTATAATRGAPGNPRAKQPASARP
jgi:membrane-bound lytic murein transglycosylase D